MKKSTPQQARLKMGLAQNSVAETTVRNVLADKAIGIINLATSWKDDKGTYPSSNEIGSLMQRVDHTFTAKKSSTWGNYSSFVHWPKETLEYLHHDAKTFPEAVSEDWAPAVGKTLKGVAAKETSYASQVPAFIKKAFVLIAKTQEAATGGSQPAGGPTTEEPGASGSTTGSVAVVKEAANKRASSQGAATEDAGPRRSEQIKPKTADEIAAELVAEKVSEEEKVSRKRTAEEAPVAPAAEETAKTLSKKNATSF
ncbi:hypothetical protein HKX48_008266 [Thoreauomyces humboldtii]|nr:hypothetical protein HKX48_008266 [Thoreauomyces humboldtii]